MHSYQIFNHRIELNEHGSHLFRIDGIEYRSPFIVRGIKRSGDYPEYMYIDLEDRDLLYIMNPEDPVEEWLCNTVTAVRQHAPHKPPGVKPEFLGWRVVKTLIISGEDTNG